MTRLPQDIFFDLVLPDEIDAAHQIESREFPPDEAATVEQFRMRQTLASSLFLGAFLPSSSSRSNRTLVGYVCSTRSSLPTLTHDSMKEHDPKGTSVCIHAVVVASDHQRRGIALALLQEYIRRVRADGLTKRILLLCHEDMRPLYEKAGFDFVGPSNVVHGALPWYEMRIVVGQPPTEVQGEALSPVASSSGESDGAPVPDSLTPGLLEALQQPSSSRGRPTPRSFSSFSDGLQEISTVSDRAKTNRFDILCPRPNCGSIILKARVGTLVDKEIEELEPAGKPPSTLLSPLPSAGTNMSCWLVQPSPMAFENIGFSRALCRGSDGGGSRPKLKLLSCADCDLGPLGWCLEGGKEFWLICERVAYRA